MAIHYESVKTGFFIGDGGERTYPFSFKIFNPADVAVYTSNKAGTDEVKLAFGEEYTVSRNADQDTNPGGSITLVNPLPEGRRMIIVSGWSYTQPTTFTNQGGFYPQVLNACLDRQLILTLQILDRLRRTLHQPITSDKELNLAIPNPEPKSGLSWSDDGTRIVNNDYPQQVEKFQQDVRGYEKQVGTFNDTVDEFSKTLGESKKEFAEQSDRFRLSVDNLNAAFSERSAEVREKARQIEEYVFNESGRTSLSIADLYAQLGAITQDGGYSNIPDESGVSERFLRDMQLYFGYSAYSKLPDESGVSENFLAQLSNYFGKPYTRQDSKQDGVSENFLNELRKYLGVKQL
nr:MAG TPA: tailspike protein [Caudoviricetes sp.]